MKHHLRLADPRTLYRIWFVLVLRAPSTVRTVSWDRYKAVVAVTGLQVMLLLMTLEWTSWALGRDVASNHTGWPGVAIAIIAYWINRHILVTRRYGLDFERVYKQLELPKRRAAIAVGLASIVLVFASFAVTLVGVGPGGFLRR